MELALVDIDLVKLRPKPKDTPQKPKPTQHQAAHAPRSRPSWFHNRGR
jgi:hypothetical protein